MTGDKMCAAAARCSVVEVSAERYRAATEASGSGSASLDEAIKQKQKVHRNPFDTCPDPIP